MPILQNVATSDEDCQVNQIRNWWENLRNVRKNSRLYNSEVLITLIIQPINNKSKYKPVSSLTLKKI